MELVAQMTAYVTQQAAQSFLTTSLFAAKMAAKPGTLVLRRCLENVFMTFNFEMHSMDLWVAQMGVCI